MDFFREHKQLINIYWLFKAVYHLKMHTITIQLVNPFLVTQSYCNHYRSFNYVITFRALYRHN